MDWLISGLGCWGGWIQCGAEGLGEGLWLGSSWTEHPRRVCALTFARTGKSSPLLEVTLVRFLWSFVERWSWHNLRINHWCYPLPITTNHWNCMEWLNDYRYVSWPSASLLPVFSVHLQRSMFKEGPSPSHVGNTYAPWAAFTGSWAVWFCIDAAVLLGASWCWSYVPCLLLSSELPS